MSNNSKSQETTQKTSSFRKPLFQKIKQFTTGTVSVIINYSIIYNCLNN
jgi:hypothetical protein